MESVLQDLRFTGRQLLKNKGFTLTAVLSLALHRSNHRGLQRGVRSVARSLSLQRRQAHGARGVVQ